MESETNVEVSVCPCCGINLPAGLFSQIQIAQAPSVVMVAGSEPAERVGRMLRFNGRYFLSAIAALPLHWPGSPVRAAIWVELDLTDAERVADLDSDPEPAEEFTCRGSLACDIPGFPGTLGSRCEFSVTAASPAAQLLGCSDVRISSIPVQPTHDELVRLYRGMWGQTQEVIPEDESLREAVSNYWKRMFSDKNLTSMDVTPPPSLSGIKPPKLILAPPQDTGYQSVLMTVGCAEGAQASGEGAELITWVRDPENEFIDCFGEFLFITRSNSRPVSAGTVVPERRPIPGTGKRMRGWLITKPWWIELPDLEHASETVSMLAAIPLHEPEMVMIAASGEQSVIERFKEKGVDVSDLKRDPVIGGFGVSF